MKRRVLVGVLAFVLAVAGGLLIFGYVRGADSRAIADQNPTPVLVVTRAVPAGTPVSDLSRYVEVRTLPKVAIVPDAVHGVDDLPADDVASASLAVGEQVLASRFAPPATEGIQAPVSVPAGLQLISVQLEPERVVGTHLAPGDTVGVFASFKAPPTVAGSGGSVATMPGASPSTQDAQVAATVRAPVTSRIQPTGTSSAGDDPAAGGQDIPVTGLLANDVLVVRVQGAATSSDASAAAGKLPGADLIVTLAVKAPLAERIVYAQENGSIWLSLQQKSTDDSGSGVVAAGNVFK